MGAFERVEEIPPDTIFGLSATFAADPRTNKVSLGVGVFRNESLEVPVLKCVHEAEIQLAKEEKTKSYLPIDGEQEFIKHTTTLAFGENALPLKEERIYGAQSVGGSGALRVASDFLHRTLGKNKIYAPDPTWANHDGIFSASQMEVVHYPYYDEKRHALAFEKMKDCFNGLERGSAILFHLCCHNPTGIDPVKEQWVEIAKIVKERDLLPLFDCAYQGFAHTMDEDVWALRHFAEQEIELLLCYSYSKNFSLYGERIGALFVLTHGPEEAKRVGSQIRKEIRENYSNPPCHGGRIVSTVLSDPKLSLLWGEEISAMRERIHTMRASLMEGLNKRGDFSFLEGQNGLFSFCGLNAQQTQVLKDKYALYMPPNGRINVTGLNQENIDYVVSAIADVL